jgi:negative regulator of flagellin synthesis FlgM
MKIDPTIQSIGGPQSDAVTDAKNSSTRASAAKLENAAPASSGDTIQISSRHAEVQQLSAQMANVPEVRAARVAPLKAAVQQGSYQPDGGKIADAMLAEQSSRSAKA